MSKELTKECIELIELKARSFAGMHQMFVPRVGWNYDVMKNDFIEVVTEVLKATTLYTLSELNQARREGVEMGIDWACEQILNGISETFLNPLNIDKAHTLHDREVFKAIGETIKKFPRPDKQTFLASLPQSDSGLVKIEEGIINLELHRMLSFNELVNHGLNNGANVVNGMPWSWKINGKNVTHENDDLYIIDTIDNNKYFIKGDYLIAFESGLQIKIDHQF